MALRPERVLAIDVARQTVRGIVLSNGTPAIAGGYAQLDFESAAGPVAFAARIATALDVKATLPVAVTCDPSIGEDVAKRVAAAIIESGFSTVTVMSRHEAAIRANPGGSETDALAGVDIPSGLLTSHAGLTLADLAAVVGSGLVLLENGAGTGEPNEVVNVWSPTSNAPPAPETDPFTSAPSSKTTAAGVAATVAAAAAAALGDDEDLTVAAPAGRLTAPVVSQAPTTTPVDETLDLAGDITGPAPTKTDGAGSEPDVDTGLSADPEVAVDVAAVAALDEDATVNPDELMAGVETLDGDATVNPHEMPAAAVAAAAVVAGGNIDETVVMDRAALHQAAAADDAAPIDRAVAPSANPPSAVAPKPAGAGSADEPASGSRRVLLVVLAAIVLVALLALGVTQCGGSDDSSTTTSTATTGDTAETGETDETAQGDIAQGDGATAGSDNESSSIEATAVPSGPEATPEPEPLPDPTVVPTATPEPEPTQEPEPTVDPLEGLPPLASLPERGAIFRPPTLFLEGPVQTQAQADALYARAIAVVGPDNVVNNYVVRPDAPAAVDGNVRVEQAVLFQSGSAVIADQFVPTLELGVAVMALNPQVQMVVEGHSDSVGSDDSNLALSQRRAEAVVAYLVSRGVDGGRLEAVGLGETSPVANNETADGRQINRRIEVNLLDLLAGE